MNELTQVFEGKQVRIIEQGGEPWFVLRDVCDVLGVMNPGDVSNRLDVDEKGIEPIDTLGGKQMVTVVNESGLYSVILRSDKPEAKRFRKWITSDVLPAIRKRGGYLSPAVCLKYVSALEYPSRLCTHFSTASAYLAESKIRQNTSPQE